MALKSIQSEWQGFSRMVFEKTPASEIQISEMKKAFFAGAWTLLMQMMEIGEDHIPEEVGCAHLESLKAECEEFKKSIMKEYVEGN